MKEVDRNIQEVAMVQAQNEKFKKDNEELEALGKKIANSKDTKESQDIANEVALKMVEIQRDIHLLQMQIAYNQSQARAEAKQRQEDYSSKLGNSIQYNIE